MEKDERIRMNIKIPPYIRDWYKEQGDRYSVPYTNYISMLLTQYYEKEKEKELVQEFNETLKKLNNMSDGSMNVEDMMKDLRSILDDINREI